MKRNAPPERRRRGGEFAWHRLGRYEEPEGSPDRRDERDQPESAARTERHEELVARRKQSILYVQISI